MFFFLISEDEAGHNSSKPSNQVIGIAKLSGFREWLLMHPIIAESDEENCESSQSSHKMIIFVHYHKVTDSLQVCVFFFSYLVYHSFFSKLFF